MNGDYTALVVDADAARRCHTVQTLFRMGYKVLYAESGAWAITIGERYRDTVHLMIAAVGIADMSGRQLAVKLQATRPGMKVLYISDHTTDERSEHTGDDTGLVLRPPFTPQRMSAYISELQTLSDLRVDYAR